MGCTEVMADGLVSDVIDGLLRQYPRLVVRMEPVDSSAPFRLLHERTCEVIIARLLASAPDIDAEALFYEQLLVVTGPRNTWAGRRKVALSQLIDERWIQARHEVEPGGPTFEAFRSCGLQVPRVNVFSNSLNLRYSLLATGRFLTMIPASVLQFGPARTELKRLPIEVPRWRLPHMVMTIKNRSLSPVAQLFVDRLRDAARPLAKCR